MSTQMGLGVDGDVQDLKIAAHLNDYHAKSLYPEGTSPRWTSRKMTGVGLGDGMRGCEYCGSMHPIDLLDLKDCETLGVDMADMKYGFPHKFYIRGISNPMAGEIVNIGGRSGRKDGVEYDEPITEESSQFRNHKFYGVHMKDLSDDPERFVALAALIDAKTACMFYVNEGRVAWKIDRMRQQEIWKKFIESTKRQ